MHMDLLGKISLSDYLAKADKQFNEEMNRINKYLTWPGIDKQIITEFQTEILMNNQNELLEIQQGMQNYENPRGLVSLFVQTQEEEMKLLYKLYKPIKDGLKPIADLYKAFLVKQGQKFVESCETMHEGKQISLKDVVANSGLIENFTGLLQKQNRIIKECFDQDTTFVR